MKKLYFEENKEIDEWRLTPTQPPSMMHTIIHLFQIVYEFCLLQRSAEKRLQYCESNQILTIKDHPICRLSCMGNDSCLNDTELEQALILFLRKKRITSLTLKTDSPTVARLLSEHIKDPGNQLLKLTFLGNYTYYEELISGLMHENCKLTFLSLCLLDNNFKSAEFNANRRTFLAIALQSNRSITDLRLIGFRSQTITPILTAVREKNNLNTLSLHHGLPFAHETIQLLTEIITHPDSTLRCLILNCGVEEAAAGQSSPLSTLFASLIHPVCKLEYLHLMGPLRDAEIASLTEALRGNCTLRYFTLSYQAYTSQHLVMINDSLKENHLLPIEYISVDNAEHLAQLEKSIQDKMEQENPSYTLSDNGTEFVRILSDDEIELKKQKEAIDHIHEAFKYPTRCRQEIAHAFNVQSYTAMNPHLATVIFGFLNITKKDAHEYQQRYKEIKATHHV